MASHWRKPAPKPAMVCSFCSAKLSDTDDYCHQCFMERDETEMVNRDDERLCIGAAIALIVFGAVWAAIVLWG